MPEFFGARIGVEFAAQLRYNPDPEFRSHDVIDVTIPRGYSIHMGVTRIAVTGEIVDQNPWVKTLVVPWVASKLRSQCNTMCTLGLPPNHSHEQMVEAPTKSLKEAFEQAISGRSSNGTAWASGDASQCCACGGKGSKKSMFNGVPIIGRYTESETELGHCRSCGKWVHGHHSCKGKCWVNARIPQGKRAYSGWNLKAMLENQDAFVKVCTSCQAKHKFKTERLALENGPEGAACGAIEDGAQLAIEDGSVSESNPA